MAKLLILGDDLTGTLECAVQFSKNNLEVVVCNHYQASCIGAFESADVLVINTDSRHLPPEEAFGRVSRLTALAREAGADFYYKKIDSLLRGNIYPECAAMLQAAGADTLYLLPAFPKNGRTTRDGCQLYQGRPITESPAGRDAFSSPGTADIAALLREQGCKTAIDKIGTDSAFPERPGRIYIFDAETDAHLLRRAKELEERPLPLAAAGCAGFCEFLSLLQRKPPAAKRTLPRNRRTLLISGSLNPISTEQIKSVEQAGFPVFYLSYPFLADRPDRLEKLADRALYALDSTGVAVLATSGSTDKDMLRDKNNMGSILAAAAKSVLEEAEDCALVIFGGDTSLQVIQALDIREVRPVCEIMPGVVCSAVLGEDGVNRTLITKSGAFGGRYAIQEILHFLDQNLKGDKTTWRSRNIARECPEPYSPAKALRRS